MKKLLLFLAFFGLLPLSTIAAPSVQWTYPLGPLGDGLPQIFADGTGGVLIVDQAGTDTAISWLDNDGEEFYHKVFHEGEVFGYVVTISRENVVFAVHGTQYFLAVTRRGVETVIPNALGGNVSAPMVWGDDKGFFTIRDAGQPNATLVRYRFR